MSYGVFYITMATFLLTLLMNEFTKYGHPNLLLVHPLLNVMWFILHPHIYVMKYCHG